MEYYPIGAPEDLLMLATASTEEMALPLAEEIELTLSEEIPFPLTEDEIDDILSISSTNETPVPTATPTPVSSVVPTSNYPRKRLHSIQSSQMDTSSSSSSESSSESSESDAEYNTPSKKQKTNSRRGRPALSGMKLKHGLYYPDGAKLHYNLKRVTVQTGGFIQLEHSVVAFSAKYANAKIGRKDADIKVKLPQLPFDIQLPYITLRNATIKDLLIKVQEVMQRSLTKSEIKLISKSKRRPSTRYIDLLKNTYYAGLREVSVNTWELLLKSPDAPFQLIPDARV